MNRIDFIKSLFGLAGLAAVPKEWVKQYDKYYLLQCFLRGFKFYEGPKLLSQIQEGDMLQLVREPENHADKFAIALHWNNHKIGYIPKEKNHILARLLDIGEPELMAEVTHLKPDAATWENVNIVVYVLKERSISTTPDKMPEYLTSLKTPNYYSLKHKNEDVVTRIAYRHPKQKEKDYDYYTFLEKHSKNDNIYNYLHEDLDGMKDYGIGNRMFAVRKDKLTKRKSAFSDTLAKAEEWMQKANVAFNEEDGYIVLSMQEAEELVPQISGLAEKVDKAGNYFIEMLLND